MRRRIAALFADFIFAFHRETFAGITATCAEHDIDLMAIVCGTWQSPETAIAMRNVLYEFIDPDKYDGFIIPFSALGQYVSAKDFREFLAPILKKPCVIIGAPEKGYPSVMPDYTSGVAMLATHLVTEHGAKRFVLVRGPVHHIASDLREAGIRESLSKLGLKPKDLTIICQSFLPELAVDIVNEIEQARLLDPKTALIFVSEPMAVATLNELTHRGHRVPDDIMICGTSASQESENCVPSLTTIDNHFTSIGSHAVEVLLRQWQGRSQELVCSPVELVPRQSCGCTAANDPAIIEPEHILALAQEMAAHGDRGPVGPESPLYHQVQMLFPGDKARHFFAAIEESLRNFKKSFWRHSELVLLQHLHLFYTIGQSLISEFNLVDLFTRLKDHLGIRHCFLSEFDPPWAAGPRLHLLQGYSNGKAATVGDVDARFDSKEFFPASLWPTERATFIIEPIFHERQHLGILAIDPGSNNVLVNEALCAQIAGAMNNQYQREKIVTLALYDSLTGLPNRRLYSDRLEIITNQCKRNNNAFSVMFIDLDNFKMVNDTFGHEVGDELLIKVARLLTTSLRDGDTVARMGGDEFVLLLPEIQSESSVVIVANRILERFRESFVGDKLFGRVTPSIGVALFPQHGVTPSDLLRHADAAMYAAKNKGKNCFRIFEEAMTSGKPPSAR